MGDFQIDIVYKRLLVNEYLPIMQECPALLDAYRAGAVCMVNSFRSKLIHKKALFAVLTSANRAHLFTADELAAIGAHVPWTRLVRAERSDYKQEEIDLLDFISANRHKLVLKPNDDYGGHGITIGWNTDEITLAAKPFSSALENGDYVVQERVPTAREIFPALKEDGIRRVCRAAGGSRSIAVQRQGRFRFHALVFHRIGECHVRRRDGPYLHNQRKEIAPSVYNATSLTPGIIEEVSPVLDEIDDNAHLAGRTSAKRSLTTDRRRILRWERRNRSG